MAYTIYICIHNPYCDQFNISGNHFALSQFMNLAIVIHKTIIRTPQPTHLHNNETNTLSPCCLVYRLKLAQNRPDKLRKFRFFRIRSWTLTYSWKNGIHYVHNIQSPVSHERWCWIFELVWSLYWKNSGQFTTFSKTKRMFRHCTFSQCLIILFRCLNVSKKKQKWISFGQNSGAAFHLTEKPNFVVKEPNTTCRSSLLRWCNKFQLDFQ